MNDSERTNNYYYDLDDEQALPIFAAHGITPVEANIFEAISVRLGTIARDRLVRFTMNMIDIWGKHTQAEYETALEDCIANNRIKVLTAEDCQQDRVRWQAEEQQYVSEFEYREGNVDFTPEGGQLYANFYHEITLVRGHRPYYRNIGYANRFPNEVRVFGAYRDEVQENVQAFLTGKVKLRTNTDEYWNILRVEGPHEIGPWWINRFVQLPRGYRVDLHYQIEIPEPGKAQM